MSEAQLNFLLKSLMQKIDGIQSSAIVSREGLTVTSILDENVSSMHIAAMSAILMSTCERILVELNKGELDVAIIQGQGKFIVMEAGDDYILVAVLADDARMDLAFTEMRKTSRQIADLTKA
ncbi:MAG TPA: roadblock/LC7 domain-containing protein [Candidatus Lokiarchaeia archaeon]|nr:roadblock/LC7 domain-containing protein [Candidatus Lokiarchaeia archaeon]